MFRVWVGMWNIGRLSAKGEVCEELRNTMIDVYGVGWDVEYR